MLVAPSKKFSVREVAAVRFGFFSDKEIVALSCKAVEVAQSTDETGGKVPGGVCDPAFGPVTVAERCVTCGLGPDHCPGHFGHIALPVAVYNPIIFTTLYKLTRSACLHCFKLKAKPATLDKLQLKLELLLEGDLVAASAVELGAGLSAKDKKDLTAGGDGEGPPPEPQPRKTARRAHVRSLDCHLLAALHGVMSQFFAACPNGKKCPHCGANNPTVKREGASKMFLAPLPGKQLAENARRRVVLKSFDEPGWDRELAQQQAAGAAGRDEAGSNGAAPPADVASARSARSELLPPSQVEHIQARLWGEHPMLLPLIFTSQACLQGGASVGGAARMAPPPPPGSTAWRMFFVHNVLVPPNKFRPVAMMGNDAFDHAHTVALIAIKKAAEAVETAQAAFSVAEDAQQEALSLRRTMASWLALQNAVNSLVDATTAQGGDKAAMGVRQTLEKKEGLFRKNMMGKRVNFACRSVISPDPFLGTGEIGVPGYFATRLSFPERVTQHNVARLRKLVEAGAATWPGAVAIEHENGTVISLERMTHQQRVSQSKQLLAGVNRGAVTAGLRGRSSGLAAPTPGKIVYRHLVDGDVMLTNRQPTLHKPGMLAHTAKVLLGERTIRMHYANCAAMNADFDGDEINLHLPQDLLGRAEGHHIVHADHQFTVPTDGKPIRGLMQDHVVAAVVLSHKDTFLDRTQFMQLLYAAMCPGRRQTLTTDVHMPPPALLKPTPLWTGKQVFSALLQNLTAGKPQLTLQCQGKTAPAMWNQHRDVLTRSERWAPTVGGSHLHKPRKCKVSFNLIRENQVLLRTGDLVTGVVDKAQYGKFGIVHGVQELYGGAAASRLMNCLSRLLTFHNTVYSHTCGLRDILMTDAADEDRQALLDRADSMAIAAHAEFVKAPLEGVDPAVPSTRPAIAAAQPGLVAALQEAYASDAHATGVANDVKVSGAMHPLSSDIIKAALPGGCLVPTLPDNCMALMTGTGAKGSNVNFSQISCLLGQQELEGRRTPRMATGKTLPCFRAFDVGARAGGFIGDRFLTGLRPQEYYFHCMAGRDGLVDTTVKTSRSGYLQRCLMKNLETLKVAYDGTVRDEADGSVVQFSYGDDGLDVTAISYAQHFKFLAENAPRVAQVLNLDAARAASARCGLTEAEAGVRAAAKARAKALAKPHKHGAALAASLPLAASHPPTLLGVTSERYGDAVAEYLAANPDRLLREGKEAAEAARVAATGIRRPVDRRNFQALVLLKFMQSVAPPGEAVGCLAAQSIGEPSTQMTLNTFHMAGRGEANVTLGIPRMREILMTASPTIKTPVMTMPLLPDATEHQAQVLAHELSPVMLLSVLKGLSVREWPCTAREGFTGGVAHVYQVSAEFHPLSAYPPELQVNWETLSACLGRFFGRLRDAVKGDVRRTEAAAAATAGLTGVSADRVRAAEGVPEAAAPGKEKAASAKDGDAEEDNEENLEGKAAFRVGGGERATYDGPDADDVAALKELEPPPADVDMSEAEDDEHAAAAPQSTASALDASAPETQPTEGVAGGSQAATTAGKSGDKAKAKGKRSAAKKSTSGGVRLGEMSVCEETATATREVLAPVDAPKLLLLELAQQVAGAVEFRSTAGISGTYVTSSPPAVQSDGINFQAAWAHDDVVDATRVTCNNVSAMLTTYGVEAARATIVAEVRNVFGAYGIGVDARHLSLIADFMTQAGGYRACNRLGIASSPSPFLKMSFETASHFLTDATLYGGVDTMNSPSSRIVCGQVVEVGTGAVSLIHRVT